MENDCPHCFSNHGLLSRYFCYSLSWSTLTSLYRTIGRICWILYSASTISLLRIAKAILDLADMVGSPSMTCYSRNLLWNCRALANNWYDWSLLLVANWCSSNASWMCSVRIPISSILSRSMYWYLWILRTHTTQNLHTQIYVLNWRAGFQFRISAQK